MPVMDVVVEYVVRYGFQVLGAVLVFAAGAIVARWAGKLAQQWLSRHDMEPPIRMLLVKIIQVLILLFTAMAALSQLGVQIAPLLAGIGVAGLGVGLALQGVLSNVIAGLSIIFTKPYRVGEHISILGVRGDVQTIDLFSTTLIHPDRSRVVIPNRKIVGEILHNFSNIRQLHLTVGVAYSTNLTQALGLIRDILAQNPGVLPNAATLEIGERRLHLGRTAREGEGRSHDVAGLERADRPAPLAGLRLPVDRNTQARDGLTLGQDLFAGRRIPPLSDEGQRQEIARTQRSKAEVVEPLLVRGQDDRPPLEINPGDLIEVDGREHERPEDGRPQDGRLKKKVRHVGERSGDGEPPQPQHVAHRIRHEKQDVREMHEVVDRLNIHHGPPRMRRSSPGA